MGYSLLQISEILLKADKTMYRLGTIAYENMFSEDSEDVDFERDIIYIYKKAVEYADDFYVGTTKLDQVVERLASKLVIYDYGQLNPIYSDATIVNSVIPMGSVLNDLDDVTITNVQNNQILKYNSALAQWINSGPSSAIRSKQSFTATLNQTVFTTTSPFEPYLLDVFLNGVKLNESNYTTFGDYQITLLDGSLADDVIDVIIYDAVTDILDIAGYVPYTGASQNVDLGEFELKAGQVEFDQSPTGTAGVGVMRWNDTDGTVDLGLKGGNVTLQVGQEQVLRVVNKTGADLLEAQYRAVRIRLVSEGGAQGQRLAVVLAQGNNDPDSTTTIGIVTETITNNQEGFITTSGEVRGINTTGSLQGETWADGDILYLSPTIAGAITKVKPTAPNHSLTLGYVVYAHINNGKIFVKVDNGYELGELHDVYVPTPSNNDGIFWNTANLRYQNNSIAGVLGYTPQSALTLTTTGSSGAATLVGATLNIPQYSGTNIYNASGTLTSDRTITSSGNSLTILGGKELTAGEQSALILQTSTTNKGSVELNLNNTFTTTGKSWRLRSLSTGALDIATGVTRAIYFDSDAKVVVNGSASIASAQFSVFGSIATNSGLQIQGDINTPSGAGIELVYNGGTSYFTSYNRTSSAWLPIIIRGSQIDLTTAGSNRARITNAGRLLLGTTTESTYILDVNGTARVSGTITGSGGKITIGEGAFNEPVINFTASSKTTYLGVCQSAGAFITAGTVGDNFIRSQDAARFFYFGSGSGGSSYFRFSYSDASIIIDGNGTGSSFTTIASSQLTVNSTTKGFLPPRMTTTQRTAISTPAVGLIVYQTDATEGTYEYTSGGWRLINAAGGGGSGITRSVNSISTATTAGSTASTDYVYFISGTTTLTLPTAVGNTNRYTLKNTGTNTVTINTSSSQTIDGSTSITLAVRYTALDIVSDGTNWNII
jgi:hypothetical protein